MALTPQQVRDAISSGQDQKLYDGHSLHLLVRNGRGYWVHRFRASDGKIHSRGVGSAATVTPAAARRDCAAFMTDKRRGVAVIPRRAKGEAFGTAADAYLSNHSAEWTPRTRADNKALFANHVPAEFNARPVTAITAEHVADVLRPCWNGPGNNRGSRLRRLIECVLNAKDVSPNPARWNGPVKGLLSKKRADVKHREAMPYSQVPAFVATLSDGTEDRAGKFVILTGVRRKEGLGAKWGEFDFTNRVWNVSVERTKKKRAHAVPLTDAMLACLGEPGAPDAFVFPSSRTGRMLGNKTCDKEWVPQPFTLHGFRTSLTTWAQEQDNGRLYPMPIIKTAIAHNATENESDAAYLRSDHFKARRELMEHWSRFVTGS